MAVVPLASVERLVIGSRTVDGAEAAFRDACPAESAGVCSNPCNHVFGTTMASCALAARGLPSGPIGAPFPMISLVLAKLFDLGICPALAGVGCDSDLRRGSPNA